MKKILLFIQLFIAVCLTACYTNVITDYEGEGDGGGGGNPSNQFITPDFVNVSPKNHLQIMGRYVDVVS